MVALSTFKTWMLQYVTEYINSEIEDKGIVSSSIHDIQFQPFKSRIYWVLPAYKLLRLFRKHSFLRLKFGDKTNHFKSDRWITKQLSFQKDNSYILAERWIFTFLLNSLVTLGLNCVLVSLDTWMLKKFLLKSLNQPKTIFPPPPKLRVTIFETSHRRSDEKDVAAKIKALFISPDHFLQIRVLFWISSLHTEV